jgi:L-ascorbate metabolism protein UlaG (beta-lactamase superfamily)
MRLTLHRGVSLAVLASARTEAEHHEDLGCSIQGPTARPLRRAQRPLERALAQLGEAQALAQAAALVRWMEGTPGYAALCEGGPRRRRLGRRLLREDVLYPDAARLRPRVLHLRREGAGLDVPVRAAEWPHVADLLAALARGASRAELRALAPGGSLGAELLGVLGEAGWLVRHTPPCEVPAPGALFVGHNTVLVAGREGRVLVDPYFRPASALDLPGYQPLQPRDLGRVDAVLITHTHGDHLHLGSLLQLPRDTRILLPRVPRESLFSTDGVLRLAQLGFTRVEALGWGEERQVGDVTVRALPFYGEQPTAGEGPYPGLFNEGNTWRVSVAGGRAERAGGGPGFSAAFFADAGRDVRGDMREVCRSERATGGPVDVLFCGIRGFRLRPLLYARTTLTPFLAGVPLDALTEPQQLMADPAEALAYGALLGARWVVPCADGGAPWYWREGMGPRYPGYPGTPVEGASTLEENPDADPFPERLADVAAAASPARRARVGAGRVREGRGEAAGRGVDAGPGALLLRPGEAVRWRGRVRAPERLSAPGFTWPFGARAAGA